MKRIPSKFHSARTKWTILEYFTDAIDHVMYLFDYILCSFRINRNGLFHVLPDESVKPFEETERNVYIVCPMILFVEFLQ